MTQAKPGCSSRAVSVQSAGSIRGKVTEPLRGLVDLGHEEADGIRHRLAVDLSPADDEDLLGLGHERERLGQRVRDLDAGALQSRWRVTTTLRRPGSAPIESNVRRPMTIGWPIVVRLKNLRSSERCHGMVRPSPMTPLRPTAAIIVTFGTQSSWRQGSQTDAAQTAMGALMPGSAT